MKNVKLISVEFTPGKNSDENLKFLNLLKSIEKLSSDEIQFTLLTQKEPAVITLSGNKKKGVDIDKLEHYLTPQESVFEFYYGTESAKSREILYKLQEYKNSNPGHVLIVHEQPCVKIQDEIQNIVTIDELFLFYAIKNIQLSKGGRASAEKVFQIARITWWFNS
jgi:hypothetical protein